MKQPHLRGSFALALAMLLSTGCAAEPLKEAAAPSPAITEPSRPGIELIYVPKTLDETAAIAKLVQDDFEIRAVLEQADSEALQAAEAYRRAALNLRSAEGGPDSPAAKEELAKLYKAAAEKVARYQGLIQTQRDRYEDYLKKYPDDWYQRHRYAWFLADHHLEEEAADEWRRVIEQAPTFPYAYNNLGTLYNHMGRDLEAMMLYRKAIELYPDDANFHLNLAVSYSTHRAEAMKQFGWDLPRVFHECILSYQRARALAPKDAEIAYDLASQYVLAKFFDVQNTADEAVEAWKYYLALDLTPTQRAVGNRNLATICLKQKNDPAAAQKLLEEALPLMPGDGTLKMLLDQSKAAQTKPAEESEK